MGVPLSVDPRWAKPRRGSTPQGSSWVGFTVPEVTVRTREVTLGPGCQLVVGSGLAGPHCPFGDQAPGLLGLGS